MVLRHICILLVFSVLFLPRSAAQEAYQSQFFVNYLQTNPAFAGYRLCPRLCASVRLQHTALETPYHFYGLSYDQHFEHLAGLDGGLEITRSQAGDFYRWHTMSAIVAKGIKIGSGGTLKVGAKLGLAAFSADFDGLVTPAMLDPALGVIYNDTDVPESETVWKFDADLGILYYTGHFFAGYALKHIAAPLKQWEDEAPALPRVHSLHAGAQFVAGAWQLNPCAQVSGTGRRFLLEGGLHTKLNIILLGIFGKYSFNNNAESAIFMLGIEQKKYKFAYNCDVPLSGVSPRILNTHELSFILKFGCAKQRPSAVECPGM